MSLKTLLATGLLLTVVSTRTLLSAPILPLTSDFDSGTQGWTLEAQTGWISSGGNPGGYLQTYIRLYDSDYGNTAHAPSTWLGDWTSLEHVATLSFDYRLFSIGGSPYAYGTPWLTLSGPGGRAIWYDEPAITSPSPWLTYNAPIELNSAWHIQSGTWAGLLANVTDVGVNFTTVSNNSYPQDVNGLDNVRLTEVPEPSTVVFLFSAVVCGAVWARAGCVSQRLSVLDRGSLK